MGTPVLCVLVELPWGRDHPILLVSSVVDLGGGRAGWVSLNTI